MTKLDVAFLERFTDRIGPIGKSLGMLIRPSFIASPGKVLTWGDWANIEARVLPWLAASPGGEAKLDIFRASDADPTKADIYISGAATFVHRDPQELWDAYLAGDKEAKSLRQSHGKVPELSLGFGGAHGALMKMAVNYRVYVDEEEAKNMVAIWRAANAWAPDFWGRFHVDRHGNVDQSSGLWGAVNMALRNPGTAYPAGRVAYVFDPSYMDGTLFCALPCGRLLTYPDCRLRTRKLKDKDTGEEIEKTAIWYRKGYGWSALWHGKAAENVTQAVAGSILRETLVALDNDEGLRHDEALIVAHVHDEIVLETPEPNAVRVAPQLKAIMEQRPSWRADLPLIAETSAYDYYTKALG